MSIVRYLLYLMAFLEFYLIRAFAKIVIQHFLVYALT